MRWTPSTRPCMMRFEAAPDEGEIVRKIVPLHVALALGALVVSSAPATASRSGQGILEMDASFSGMTTWADSCPQTSPGVSECTVVEAKAGVSGLGATSLRFTFVNNAPNGVSDSCRLFSTSDATFAVTGKGQIQFTALTPSCEHPPDATTGTLSATLQFTVSGGSGIYAGATGDGTLKVVWHGVNAETLAEWVGNLSVPGLEFDTTSPTVSGAKNRLVSVTQQARGARVRYAVTASDAADGTVPATCRPRSGSFFRVGRTQVRCSATDSSSNSTTKSFTVVVKRR
jgi:HYR domain